MKLKKKKPMMKAVLLCGSCMLIAIYTIGCETDMSKWKDDQQRQPMGQFFPAPNEQRDVDRIMRVSAAAGARGDATLQPYHFDKGELNSLGRQKLSLMLDDDDANNPIAIYLNLPADDEFKAARQDSIIAYLKDQGLEEKQVAFKQGSNPATNHPAADGLARLAKTETGAAGAVPKADAAVEGPTGDASTGMVK